MKNEECKAGRRYKTRHRHVRAILSLTIRHSSFVILLTFITLLLPTLTFADSSNRWLLIFDTSSSMRNRVKGMEEMMQDLLVTGMHGQLQHGDTIGIWTFNDRLHSGEAPLQVWTPEVSQSIARRTLQYLDALRYGKSANMTAMLTNMYDVVDSSDFITVILFSDGDQPIKGTPFDEEINKLYKDNYRQQKKSGMPVITVLQAKHGNFFTNTVNFGPWPIEIPAVPQPPRAPKPVEPQAAPKPAPPAAPPIIFDGRKSQQSAAPENTAPSGNNPAELAPPVVTRTAATATPAETPAPTQPATAPPAPPPVVAGTTQPAATPPPAAAPPEVAANNQPESKPDAAPVPAPAPNQSEPPPTAPPDTADKSAATTSPVEAATSVPSTNLLSSRNVAIASVAFAVIVCGLLLLAARNARKTRSSLITRSLDREQH